MPHNADSELKLAKGMELNMNSRQRVLDTLRRKPVDVPAVEYKYNNVGIHEHGEKINELFAKYPGDFSAFVPAVMPNLPPELFDENGQYHKVEKDEWGILREHRIYGHAGYVIKHPISSVEEYNDYELPPLPDYCTDPVAFEREKEKLAEEKQGYMTFRDANYMFLLRLIHLRGFEDALMDLFEDGPEINAFMDRMTEYYMASIHKLIEMGVDAIAFGDDYGTQQNLILSVDLFRKTIFHRLKKLMDPIREAGIHIHFHSCGQIIKLLPLFEEMGVNSIWPQLPAYEMTELAAVCDRHNLTIALHTDRAYAMTSGTPEYVRELVRKEADIFRPQDGNGWFFIEIDSGFPYENIVALVEEIFSLRKS